MQVRVACGVLAVLLTGCARGTMPAGGGGDATARAVASADTVLGVNPLAVVPVVDHHKHAPSVAAAALISPRPLPAVALPAELDRVLQARARRWNDAPALAPLLTDSSVVLDTGEDGWVRGREEVAGYLSRLFRAPYAMTPVAYEMGETSGYVAGYYTRGAADSTRHIGYFHLALRRGPDGAWRIAAESPVFPGPFAYSPITAEQVVAELDSLGTRRGVLLSVAYWFGSPNFDLPDELARVRAENDYTARQVARFPDRLVGFCSVSPLRDYAVAEIERCARELGLTGLKLHFGSSRVDVLNPEHVEKVRRVFETANRLGLPIAVHTRGVSTTPYGREHAQAFLDRILPAAPDIPVTVAHLWGGAGFSDEALGAFAAAVEAGDPRTRNLWFDVTDIARVVTGPDMFPSIARRIRQIGPERILWGSDMSPPNPPAREAWIQFVTRVPLTERELRAIAGNVAPYLRTAPASAGRR